MAHPGTERIARSLGEGEPLEGFSASKLRNYYLLNPEEAGEKHTVTCARSYRQPFSTDESTP